MQNAQLDRFSAALSALEAGDVIGYPTEAVYGLGCDPDNEHAVSKVLALKNRPIEKGLIVIAGAIEQLSPWINTDKLKSDFPHVVDSWPGANTWLLPCKAETPTWLKGQFDTLAVRVSDHPDVKALCAAYGKGIVSTSANPSGEVPARSAQALNNYFPDLTIVDGAVDLTAEPSVIRDAATQKVIRA